MLVIANSMTLRFTKVLVGYIKTYDEVVENNNVEELRTRISICDPLQTTLMSSWDTFVAFVCEF